MREYDRLFGVMTRYFRDNPTQRRGQAYFNGLFEDTPALADEVRGTEDDPFMDDRNITRFLIWLVQRLR